MLDARKILGNHLRIIGNGDFRFFDFGMPRFFPFEGVVTRISDSCEQFDLPLHGNIATARQDVIVLAIC